ncbi:hypothetical protein C0J52_07515 [Blattella germanica]|nr:hypothetical protein C0J52_07515 [Blattella germanica]
MTLTDTRNLFNQVAEKDQNYSYLAVLANHIDLIANIPVRNIGTLAGNLMTKYSHTEFPSDLFLILETVGATITIASKNGTETMSIPEFLDIQMNHKIILSITLHPQDKNDYIKTYKIHAENTENYLNGKNLFDQKVLQTALHILEMELSPQQVLPGASSEYKRKLACALFYKSVLNLSPRGLPDSFKSGGFELTRPLSRGQQTFQTNEKEWPLTKPIPKIEALAQTSGTAQYVNDMPAIPGQLFGAFVLTTVARGYISNIDATEALNMPGVVSFRKAEDIPGKNNFIVGYTQLYTEEEEIYCSGEVKYAGQTVGLIVAESQMAALEAVSKVKIKYNNIKKPIIKIQDAIDSGDKWRIKTVVPAVELEEQNATHVIEGTFESGYQYHFPLETMQCFCVPTQDGIDLYPSTQFVDLVQLAISQAVKMPENRITIKVRQLGGAFGCKLSRSAQIAVACAEAAISINRPVRISMPLETHMESVGMRYDSLVKYKVGVDDTGKIQYLNADLYEGAGAYFNEKYINEGVRIFKESYDSSNWKVAGLIVKTDIPTTLWC